MNHRTSILCRPNIRAYAAAFISYMMLVGQVAPLALAAAPKAPAPSTAESSAAVPSAPLAAAPLPAPMPVFAPSITATKEDSFLDPNGNMKAEPGDTVSYTVTITNNGPDPATGVVFNDMVDPNTMLVSGSIATQPIAAADTFTAFGNVQISTAKGAANLLANDCDPDPAGGPCTNAGLTASGPTTSTNNGNVVVNSDGTFTYNPPVGFTGSDTFTYTIKDAGLDTIPGNADDKSDTATVTITVGPTLVWFINNTAGACTSNCDGRYTNPFPSIAAYNSSPTPKDTGDIIFIYTGTSNYTGGLTLVNNMKVIGQGFALATETGTVPPGSETLPGAGTPPTIDNAGGTIITLAQNNTLRGFNTGNSGAAGTDIAGTGFATLTASALSLNGDGRALNLTNGTLAVAVSNILASNTSANAGVSLNNVGGSLTVSTNTTITNPGGNGIDVTNAPATASYNFGTTSVSKNAAGVGVNLATNNAAAAISFPSLTITNTAGNGLVTSGGGSVTVTTGSLSAAGAAASLTNTAVTMTFTSVSSSAGANGILISGGSGSFTSGTTNLQNNTAIGLSMAGSAIAASFGNTTVNSSGGDAVDLSSNSGNITFADLDLTPDATFRGLDAQNNTGTLTATSGDITTSGGNAANAVFIDGPLGRTPINLTFNSITTTSTSEAVRLVDVSGTKFQVTGTTLMTTRVNGASGFGTAPWAGVFVDNSTATNIQFATISMALNPNNAGGHGLRVSNSSSAVTITTANISNAKVTVAQTDSGDGFPDNDGDGDAIFLKSNTGSFTLSGGTLSNNANDAIDIRTAQNMTLSGVTIDGVGSAVGATANVGGIGGHGIFAWNLSGTNSITNCTIKNWDAVSTNGLRWWVQGALTGTLTVKGSTFSDSGETSGGTNPPSNAILYRGDGTSTTTLTVGGPNVGDACTFNNIFGEAVGHAAGGAAGSTATANMTVESNNFTNSVNGGQNSVSARNVEGGKATIVIKNNTFDNVGRTLADTSGVIDLGGDATIAGNSISFSITGNTIKNIGTNTQCLAPATTLTCQGKRAIDVFIDDNSNISGPIVIDSNVIYNVYRMGIIFDSGSVFNGTNYSAKITNNRVGIRPDNTIDRVGKGNALATGGENGIRIENRNQNAKNLNILVSGNLVYNGSGAAPGSVLNSSGMLIRTQNTATMSATVTNNTVNVDNPNTSFGFNVATVNGTTNTLCFDATGNTITAPGGGFALSEATGSLNIEQASAAALQSANSGTNSVSVVTGTPQFSTPCAAPPAISNGPVTSQFVQPSASPRGKVSTEATSESAADADAPALVTPTAPKAVAPKAVKAEAKREGGTTFRYAAADTSAPLNPQPAPVPEPAAQRRKVSAPVLTDSPVGSSAAAGPISINLGTLAPGDSVTITFQVTINNPYSGGPTIENQGVINYGPGTLSTKTYDPATGGPANLTKTLTPVNATDIRVNDATASEPATSSSQMLFTLTLSQPAPAGGITVNYMTADGGATPATSGAACGGSVDYVTASGPVTVPSGSQTTTIPITICADSDSPENSETFLVNISGASSGTIVDAQATGTITQGTTAGTFLISEIRTSGPVGLGDDFVEFYNNTDAQVTVMASDASAGYGIFKMGANCTDTPVLIGTIPNGTIIPKRGHYLAVGSQYSLANYGGSNAATGNLTLTGDIDSDRNVAVFSTANVALISSASRLDAVGFDGNTGGVCDLLREGTNLGAAMGSNKEYSFFRNECGFGGAVGCTAGGNPKDTNNNLADFTFADTAASNISGIPQRLGAPGPENLASPLRRDSMTPGIGAPLLDATVSSSSPPNRVRSFTMDAANNSANGTLTVRRRVTNNTGGPVTRLRFRIVEMTTFPTPDGTTADLRARTGVDEVNVGPINDAATCTAAGFASTPCSVSVQKTTLEQPPTQTRGGGINSTLSVGTITLATPLANNASLPVNFLLGVQTPGTFRFYIIIEALP